MLVSVVWTDDALVCGGGLQDISPPHVDVLDAEVAEVIVYFVDVRSARSRRRLGRSGEGCRE